MAPELVSGYLRETRIGNVMTGRLNPSQRLWGLFLLVFLVTTGAFMATVWPQAEPGIVADLRSPDCQAWRGMPEGKVPDVYPEPNQPCYSIRSFMYHKHVSLRSEADYEGYLAGQRARTALNCLAVWAGFSVAVYLLVWSSQLITRALLKLREGKAG